MPKITSFKSQKNASRVNVYLDGKFSFGIDLDNFVKFGLKVGDELSYEKVNEIVKKAEFQKTLDKLLRFTSIRPRSEKEVYDYLKKKKVYETLYSDLIGKLKYFDLLDDEKFTSWWIEQRLQFKSKSKKDIIWELGKKGIKRALAEKILKGHDFDEKKSAQDLISKYSYRWEGLDKKEKFKKESQYLLRKGFGWDVVKKALLFDPEGQIE